MKKTNPAMSINGENEAHETKEKPTEPYIDVTTKSGERVGLPAHGHNFSAQHHVTSNPDLALHYSHEHEHKHLHHSHAAEAGRKDDIAYSMGTTFERSNIPNQNPQDYDTHPTPAVDEKTIITQDDTENDGLDLPASEDGDLRRHRWSRLYRKNRILVHIFIWLLFTGWWIAGLILHRYDLGWLIPFLLYLAITLRLIFFHVSITVVTKPMHWTWDRTGVQVYKYTPEKLRKPVAAAITVAVILVGTFVTEETADNTRANRAVSLFGLVVMIALLYATSKDRSKIKWHTVIGGMLTQFVIAVFVLRTGAGYDIFSFISGLARDLLGFAGQGTSFLTAPSVCLIFSFWSLILTLLGFDTGMVPYRRCPSNHLLCVARSSALLFGHLAMVYRQIRAFLLLDPSRLGCGSGRCCGLAFYWPGRVSNVSATFCSPPHSGRDTSGHDFWICHYIWLSPRGLHLARLKLAGSGVFLYHVHSGLLGSVKVTLSRN